MVAKTIGFNWGPAGTACGRWTGVRLADVLRACGMRSAEQGAHYVCFRGPKNELPQGGGTKHSLCGPAIATAGWKSRPFSVRERFHRGCRVMPRMGMF